MNKTLIAYATKHGSTEECAKKLAEKLNSEADLLNLKGKKQVDLSSYDKIIIGGSIYAGRIQKEVSEFCSKNQAELQGKKIGLFICGMSEGEAAEEQIATSFPAALVGTATAKESFGGKFDFSKLNFMEKVIVKKVAKIESDSSSLSETTIERFAQTLDMA